MLDDEEVIAVLCTWLINRLDANEMTGFFNKSSLPESPENDQ